jgi:Dolichyl-phosphate-mannose-protein mannosyltransferase
MTSEASSDLADGRSAAMPRGFFTPSILLLSIACYFAWQVMLRLVTSNSAGLDEGEQLLLTQKLAWGYGPQPPLYTWLQYPFICLFGPSILSVSLFKNLLLFGIYSFTFLNARRLTRANLPAAAAAISLLFVPQISWECQRDLTQSVLATMLSAATFYVFLRLSEMRRLRWYALFGICAALGTLAKYNYLIFLVGLIGAALSLKPLRSVVWNLKMLMALALSAALTTPHWMWALQHSEALLATAGKLRIENSHSWVAILFAGIKNLAGSVGVHVGALLGIYLIVCRKHPTPPAASTANPVYLQLLERSFAVIFVLLILATLCFHVTNFRDRWLLPVLICLPVYLAARLTPRLNAARLRVMIGIGVAVMLIVSILLPGRIWFAGRWCKPSQLNAPFDRLAAQMRPSVSPDTVFVAENSWMGGNLRLFFPNHTIVTPRWPFKHFGREGDNCLLVWDATRDDSPPEPLADFAAANVESNSGNCHFIEAPLKFCHTNYMRLGLMRGRLKNPSSAEAVENASK